MHEFPGRGPFESAPNAAGGGSASEAKRPEQRERITPEGFIADGNSRRAIEFARGWEEAQAEGELTAIIACSDARTIYCPKNAVGIRTIGAAVPEELYDNVLSRSFGTRNVVVMAHHDGRLVEPGMRPPGCGGRDEKAKLREALENPTSEGALRYVREHIAHEDPIIDAWSSALAIAEQANLPVLAATQDHVTGILIPLAAFQPTEDGGLKIVSEISLRKILHEQYDPHEIYADGIPGMPFERIPQEFMPFMKRHELYLHQLKAKNPELSRNQAVQNPDTVLITTVVRPSRGRLPNLSGESANRVFAITVARQGETSIDVDAQSIIKAGDELEYPLGHGLQSRGDASKPFSALYDGGTVVIETRNMAKSRLVAEDLLKKTWFKRWANNEGNRVIVAQTTRGIVDYANYFQAA